MTGEVEELSDSIKNTVMCSGYHFEPMNSEYRVTLGNIVVFVCRYHKDIFIRNGRLRSIYEETSYLPESESREQTVEKPN